MNDRSITVVLIHGAGDSAAVWEHQSGVFGEKVEPIALDLPGHGARLSEQGLSTHPENARDVVRQVQQRSPAAQQLIVIGHSMGGAVALTLALDHPELVRALVLVGSGGRLRMRQDFIDDARTRAETAPPGEAVGALIPIEMSLSPQASPETRAWMLTHTGQATAQAVYADFMANNGFDVMERLGEIGVPVLVVGGADDKMAPPKYQQALGERIATARLELLPGAGHYPQAEQPEPFNQIVRAFVKGRSA